MKVYLKDKKYMALSDAAQNADEYVTLHKLSRTKGDNKSQKNNDNAYDNNRYKPRDDRKDCAQGHSYAKYSDRRDSRTYQNNSVIICHYCKLPNHKQRDCPKRRQDNAKRVVYVIGKNIKSKSEFLHKKCHDEFESKALKDNMIHIYPVSFKDGDNKVNIVVQGYRDTGANICVIKENFVPEECLVPLNKTIGLTGFYAGVNTAPMFRANVSSPKVNGEIDVAVVSSACNFPHKSSMIVGEDYGVPYGIIQGFVNVIMNDNQIVFCSEELNECNDIEISLNNVNDESEDVIMSECNGGDELSNTLNVLFNDDERYINTEKLCVMQRKDERLKVIFNEVKKLNEGQEHSYNYSIHKNGLLIHSMHDKLRDETDESVNKQIVIPFSLRKKILYLAHELPSAGHLGVNKTFRRICKYF